MPQSLPDSDYDADNPPYRLIFSYTKDYHARLKGGAEKLARGKVIAVSNVEKAHNKIIGEFQKDQKNSIGLREIVIGIGSALIGALISKVLDDYTSVPLHFTIAGSLGLLILWLSSKIE